MTKYTVVVDLAGHVWELSKRYSDFEVLHVHLRRAYSQVVPQDQWPPFPQKTWLGRFTDETIEQRRKLLEDFMQSAVSRPMYPVNMDLQLWDFLELEPEPGDSNSDDSASLQATAAAAAGGAGATRAAG